jgi:hypothetical protein
MPNPTATKADSLPPFAFDLQSPACPKVLAAIAAPSPKPAAPATL